MMKRHYSVLILGLAVCAGMTTASFAQSRKPTLEERYEAGVRSCEWGHRSRASSRNYQSGKTKAEVDAKYQSCLAVVKKQYDSAAAQRARRLGTN